MCDWKYNQNVSLSFFLSLSLGSPSAGNVVRLIQRSKHKVNTVHGGGKYSIFQALIAAPVHARSAG